MTLKLATRVLHSSKITEYYNPVAGKCSRDVHVSHFAGVCGPPHRAPAEAESDRRWGRSWGAGWGESQIRHDLPLDPPESFERTRRDNARLYWLQYRYQGSSSRSVPKYISISTSICSFVLQSISFFLRIIYLYSNVDWMDAPRICFSHPSPLQPRKFMTCQVVLPLVFIIP